MDAERLRPVGDRHPERLPDDPLAQTTRARLFTLLARLRRAASTEELAAELGLHPSGVRVHLDRLHQAGLVCRELERRPIGRPRDSWSISSEALPGGEPPGAYRQLARWLAVTIKPTPRRLRELERDARRLGRELLGDEVTGRDEPAQAEGLLEAAEAVPGVGPIRATEVAPAEAIGRTFTALGFAPQRRHTGEGVKFTLRSCPYRDAVRDNPLVVCALHRGLTLGLLDQLQPVAELKAFVPRDPDLAGCEIEIAGV